ncbi:Ig-like domain-containing protein [Plantactinospora sp. WMMB782]|uniref:Ig-like domain-containing protein n=1 Tax=Plantactinospora sp. WMMB782 TaxID=3404121 RepID=UPI003B93F170
MWRRNLLLTASVVLAVVLGGPAPARAGGADEPILGDFNADGFEDVAVLGSVSPNLCSTITQYGSATGVYLPPIVNVYLSPNGSSSPNCPDLGTAVDVDDDPADELWIGWSQGPPGHLTFNRLVLQPPTFLPSAYYTSTINRPVLLDTGAFSRDGRESPYATGPGGLLSYIIDGSQVTPGPVAYCSVDTPTAQLADWNADGIESVLLAYTRDCADDSNGVVEIRQDGTVRRLENDPTGRTTWTARVIDADGDRYPDASTTNQATGEVSHFVNTGAAGGFLLTRAPDANTDRISLASDKALAIDVLGNDFTSRDAEVLITNAPRYGTVQVLSDRRILYRPASGHGQTDRFTYQLVERGRRSSATVYLTFPRRSG